MRDFFDRCRGSSSRSVRFTFLVINLLAVALAGAIGLAGIGDTALHLKLGTRLGAASPSACDIALSAARLVNRGTETKCRGLMSYVVKRVEAIEPGVGQYRIISGMEASTSVSGSPMIL